MKLLSVARARSIWLLYLADMNPRGLYDYSIVQPLINKYKFLKPPTEYDSSKGIAFLNGNFQKGPKHNVGADLTLYNDGLMADTRSSTADSDAFLDDLLTWTAKEFGLVSYEKVLRRKLYLSELWVQIDKSLNTLNPKLKAFAEKLNSLISGHSDHPIAFETSGITFWTDPTLIPNPPGVFRFERVLNTPFSENRYYSVAPLQTEVHLEMLEEFEGILGS